MGLIKKFLTPQFIKFVLVGIVNTIFGYLTFSLLIFLKLPYPMASFLALLLGVIFNFFSFSLFVFHKGGPRSSRLRFSKSLIMRYIIIYGTIYVTNICLLKVILSTHISIYIAQILCLPILVVISFFGNKYVTFRV